MLKGLRQHIVKAYLLGDLEVQYLKFQTIIEYMLRQKLRLELQFEAEGLHNIDGVRNKFADVKKKREAVLLPYDGKGKSTIPESDLKLAEDLQVEKTKLEGWIDKYDDLLSRLDQKQEALGETLFHIDMVRSKTAKWLKESDGVGAVTLADMGKINNSTAELEEEEDNE